LRVAVTGASGFVGGAVVCGLRARGHQVFGASRRGPDIRWDITTGLLIDAPTVDAVVHCAALVADGPMKPRYLAVNVDGTRNVIESFPGARFIHISTASVYDPCAPKRLVAEDAPAPRRWLNGYGQSKHLAEQLVIARRPDAAILRPHAVYGPDDITLLPRVLRARLMGRQLAAGDGRNRLTLTAVDNLVDAVQAALVLPHTRGPFNIGDPDTPTVAEVLRALLESLGLPQSIWWIPRPVAWRSACVFERLAAGREPVLSRYAVNLMSLECTLSLDRARRLLGWEPALTYRTVFPTLAARVATHN
jgi:nucleoside-diphosphate-sugar epimerase